MPLEQQLSRLYLNKKTGLFGVGEECASYLIQITFSNLVLRFM